MKIEVGISKKEQGVSRVNAEHLVREGGELSY